MSETAWEAFCASGLWRGLSRAVAAKLVEAGLNSPEDVTREALLDIEGIGPKRAETLIKSLGECSSRWDVAKLLHQADLPVRLAFGVVDELGRGAGDALAADPWLLLAGRGVEPAEADRLALAILIDKPSRDDPRRGRAFVAHVLAKAARDGHTVMPEDLVARAITGLAIGDPRAAITAALGGGDVERFDDSEPAMLGLIRYAGAEDSIAEGIARLASTAQPLATPEAAVAVSAGLDPAQREAVKLVAQHGVAVLHGGPGTGKSRTIAAVVELAAARDLQVALAAPTGRAARRLEELTDHPATTLHRMLGAQGGSRDDEDRSSWMVFARGEGFPVEADLIVVDESSMLDVELCAALLGACEDGTHLLFVGDPAQLPSIGPGRVLADILACEQVPAVELTTLHRQAEGGTIARLAGSVREGVLPVIEDPTREAVLVGARNSAEAAHRVIQLVTGSIPDKLGIATTDIQVITPVHRGPAGTIELNRALKAALNPGSGAVSGFDVGDRVVATANYLDNGFANGDIGVVTAIDGGKLVVEFSSMAIAIPDRAVADLRHGWAITVHRSQGSEWPAVVAVLPPEASGMLSRPLIYTALTRAQRHLSIVHAAGAVVARAVRDVDARPRRTRLARLITGAG